MSSPIVSGAALGVVVAALVVFDGACLVSGDAGDGGASGNNGASLPRSQPAPAVGYSVLPIQKIDILFDVDNSSSMGDKQAYLEEAIPDLITRITTPNCVDSQGNAILNNGTQLTSDSNGNCAMGQPELTPVHDLHVGVVTSSLGGRGTTSICQTMATPGAQPADYLEFTSGTYQQFLLDDETGNFADLTSISKNNDDQGHLINRTGTPTNPDGPTSELVGNFLAWAPPGSSAASPVNGVSEATTVSVVTDYKDIVVGAGAFGCGIESQLESWYRFLIQPDPYLAITTTTNSAGLAVASWSGVDTTILQQRADFLRPDSLVLIVDLTDENDSEIDVRTIGGIGVNWLDSGFQPPLPTTACASDPGDPNCQSCAFDNSVTNNDPNCQMSSAFYPLDETNFGFNDNLRHVHMKQKYGVDLQFPINRYVLGLTSSKVPNRDGEYPPGGDGYYQGGLQSDPNDLNCVNPLFAQNLPIDATGPGDSSICNLTPSTARTPESNLVYYAHIGGVPNELLTTNVNGVVTPKDTLAASDWQLILGNDPENYDYSGIDPHMIESYQPRPGMPVAGSGAAVVGDEAPDYVTDGETPARVNLPVDLEYACVFPLATPRNCDTGTVANPSTQTEADIGGCACSTTGLAAADVPSVCDAENPLQQDYAKAYPTIRELMLAERLRTQGIVGSICPIDVQDNAEGNDPLYGYRPVVAAIIERLKR